MRLIYYQIGRVVSSFTEAKIEKTGKKRHGRPIYRVKESFFYEVGFIGSGLKIEIPAGFESDLVSAPWWCAWLLPLDHMKRPAILHDYLREKRPDIELWRTNLIFLEAMYADRTIEPAKTLAWLATRTNKNRERKDG